MDEEMQGGEGGTGWRKAVPQTRDRLQSKVLVWVVGALLVCMSADAVRGARTFVVRFPVFVLEVFVLSAAFALVVRKLRAATPGGAVFGGMICLLVTFWTGIQTTSVARSGLTPLVLLFLLTFLATRGGRKRKTVAGLAEGRRGRNAGQVIANLSDAGMCASPWTAWMGGKRSCELRFDRVCGRSGNGWDLVVGSLNVALDVGLAFEPAVEPADVEIETEGGVADDLMEVAHGEVVVRDVADDGTR